MVDRRINFGDPADSGTRYQIEDDANAAGGGNFVLAKDLDGGTVLLQYNPTSDAFEYVRSVDMSGEDVTGVGGVVGESGTGVYDDATQTVGDGTTSADHASVNTGELNNTRFVDASDGASAVNTAISEAQAANQNRVFVYGNSAEWSETVRVADDFSIEFQDGLEITVADNHNLDEPSKGTTNVVTLITNEDHSTTSASVEIAGEATIDFSNVSENTNRSYAPVWLDNVDFSRIEGVTVENVISNPSNTSQRHYGVLLSDGFGSKVVDCTGNNCGYEGIGLRGNCGECEIINCDGDNNRVHAIQAAAFSPGDAGSVVNSEIRDCEARSNSIIIHGKTGEVCQNVEIIDCNAEQIVLAGELFDCHVRECSVGEVFVEDAGETSNMDDCSISNNRIDTKRYAYSDHGIRFDMDNGHTVDYITIEGNTFRTDNQIVQFDTPDGSISAVEIRNNSARSDNGNAFDTTSSVSNVAIVNNKFVDFSTILAGAADTVRLSLNRHGSASLTDGTATNVTTTDNDAW